MSTTERRGPKQSKWASWQQLKTQHELDQQSEPTVVTERVVELFTTIETREDVVVNDNETQPQPVKKFNKKKDI